MTKTPTARATTIVAACLTLAPACWTTDSTDSIAADELGGATLGGTGRSGSRLEARAIVSDGGLAQFETMFDTALGTDCAFGRTPDGAIVCGPFGPQAAIPYLTFADPACASSPIAVMSFEQRRADGSFATQLIDEPATTLTCDERLPAVARFWTRATEELPLGVFYQRDHATGECLPIDFTGAEAFFRAFAVAPTPTSALVTGTLATRSLGGRRLEEVVVRGADGSVSPIRAHAEIGNLALHDRGLDTDVVNAFTMLPVGGRGGELFWPGDVSFATSAFFAGDSCTTPAGRSHVQASCELEPYTVTRTTPGADAGTGRRSYRTAGARATAISLVRDGTCRSFPASSSVIHEVGGPADPAPFVRGVTRRIARGALAREYARNSDGSTVPLFLYDDRLESECRFEPQDDGALRCMPWFAPAGTAVFLDPGCTSAAIAMGDAGDAPIAFRREPTDHTVTRLTGGGELSKAGLVDLYTLTTFDGAPACVAVSGLLDATAKLYAVDTARRVVPVVGRRIQL